MGYSILLNDDSEAVFYESMTWNLVPMLRACGLYYAICKPGLIGVRNAGDIIFKLRLGLVRLEFDPKYFERFNPSNGWGSYEFLLKFVQEYLQACERYPLSKMIIFG